MSKKTILFKRSNFDSLGGRNTQELQEFVISEATGMDGIPVVVRMGRDPGRERMTRVVDALNELDPLMQGRETLDHRFAYALYCLAYYVESNIESWIREGKEWPEALLQFELPSMLMNIEYIFDGGLFDEDRSDSDAETLE